MPCTTERRRFFCKERERPKEEESETLGRGYGRGNPSDRVVERKRTKKKDSGRTLIGIRVGDPKTEQNKTEIREFFKQVRH